MKDKIKSFNDKYILPILVSVAAVGFPTVLLVTKLIDGASFVALIAIIIFSYSLFKLLPRVSEFSIAGNSIKLKETLVEASMIMNDLRELRKVSMLQFFDSMYKTNGNNHDVMRRMYNFFMMYNVISLSSAVIDEYKTEIINSLSCLSTSSLQFISGHLSHDEGLSTIEKVREVYDKFKSESEEHFLNFPGHRSAKEFSQLLIMLDRIYCDVTQSKPEPVLIPEFLGPYKVQVIGR